MTIGEFIRMKRLAQGMSQATLYKAAFGDTTRLDKGRNVISRIEKGQKKLDFQELTKIARVFGRGFIGEFLDESRN